MASRSMAIALMLLGCGKQAAAPRTEEAPVTRPADADAAAAVPAAAGFSRAPRAAEARRALPAVAAPLVPRRGIYAAGGGLTSSPWRAIVDLDAKTLAAGRSSAANAPSYGKLDEEKRRALDDEELADLVALADRAWREPAAPFAQPIADYDEILIVADGDDTFFLQGFGPIRAAEAAALVARLRTAAVTR